MTSLVKSLETYSPTSVPAPTLACGSPAAPTATPDANQVVAYLVDYAQRFGLPVALDSPVGALRAAGDGYRVELEDRTLAADQVVVATGPFQGPRTPKIAARLDAGVAQLHSSDYRSPRAVAPGSVLVVGAGNTGVQIAAELAHSHRVHLSIGSRQAPLPQRALGRDLFTWLENFGLMSVTGDSRIGRRMRSRDALIGPRPSTLRRRHGVELHGRAVDACGSRVVFEDGTSITVAAVIWATGFASDHSWVRLPVVDDAGHPIHGRGVTSVPGLYFLGLPWLHTRGSALLGWVKADAEHLAARILERRDALERSRPGTPVRALRGAQL